MIYISIGRKSHPLGSRSCVSIIYHLNSLIFEAELANKARTAFFFSRAAPRWRLWWQRGGRAWPISMAPSPRSFSRARSRGLWSSYRPAAGFPGRIRFRLYQRNASSSTCASNLPMKTNIGENGKEKKCNHVSTVDHPQLDEIDAVTAVQI